MTTTRLIYPVSAVLMGTALLASACGSVEDGTGTDSFSDTLVTTDEGAETTSSASSAAQSDDQTTSVATSTRPATQASTATTSTPTSPASEDNATSEPAESDAEGETSGEGSEPEASSNNSNASTGSTDEATESDSTSEMDTSDDPTASDEVPMTEHCEPVADWDAEWVQWEEEVLLLVNEYRAEGADCGEEGVFGPADPLEMDPILRCSSRLHSLDMFDRMFFDHNNLDGLDPFDRMDAAGFSGSYMGENIAMGQTDPVEVMEAWIDSDGHCSNVMSPNFTLIGVGYYPGSLDDFRSRHYWTQNFGAPQREFGGGMGGGLGGGGN